MNPYEPPNIEPTGYQPDSDLIWGILSGIAIVSLGACAVLEKLNFIRFTEPKFILNNGILFGIFVLTFALMGFYIGRITK